MDQPQHLNKIDLTMFFCYARENIEEKKKLIKYLTPLRKHFGLKFWADEKIPLGAIWEQEIKKKLNKANIFLFLLSPDSLASDFINNIEFTEALWKSNQNLIDIIPVLIHPCDWTLHDVERFQILPRNAQPIEDLEYWKNPYKGYEVIANELRKHLEDEYFNEIKNGHPEDIVSSELDNPVESENSNNLSLNTEEMYRQSWEKQKPIKEGSLPFQIALKTLKKIKGIRTNINELDDNLAGFKSDLSHILSDLRSFTKEFEEALKATENQGHPLFRLNLEVIHHISETRNQLLKTGVSSSKGREALSKIKSYELIYLDYAIEKLENELIDTLKKAGFQPN